MIDFNKLYHDFMRRKVDTKWLSKYKYLTVLGENFIDRYYILVLEIDDMKEVLDGVFGL